MKHRNEPREHKPLPPPCCGLSGCVLHKFQPIARNRVMLQMFHRIIQRNYTADEALELWADHGVE